MLRSAFHILEKFIFIAVLFTVTKLYNQRQSDVTNGESMSQVGKYGQQESIILSMLNHAQKYKYFMFVLVSGF